MIDHIKSIEMLGCVYWKKAKNKNFHVGDLCYLYLSGKGHNQIRYCLEVVDTSCERVDKDCWIVPFLPDKDCYKLRPIGKMYDGNQLSLNDLEYMGINRHTQFQKLNDEQALVIDSLLK